MTELTKITAESNTAMGKAVENTRRELSTIRGGKASPNMLDTIRVDSYGQHMALNQVASVSTPEPRLLLVQPWDKALIPEIEKAIRASDLGLNPANDGNVIRVPVPQLNEERRRDLVKVVKKLAEEGRIGVRHARTDALHRVKKVEHVSDDDKHHEDKEIQRVHDDHIAQIDDLVKLKEQEVMEV